MQLLSAFCQATRLGLGIILVLAIQLSGCGGGGANSSAGTGNVGSTGGTVASSDGVVQLEIPAGALLGATTFSFAPIDTIPNLPADVTLLPGTAFQITWTGAGFTQDGAATIRLRNSGTNQVAAMEVSTATPPGLEGTVLMCGGGTAPTYVMPEQVGTYLQFNYTMGACPAQGGADPGQGGSTQTRSLSFGGFIGFGPAITQQPVSVTAQEGDTVNFSVTASGIKPLSYQWRCNGTNIAGATDPTYSVTVSSTNKDDGFSVVVTNVFGSVTSNVATLTGSAPPVGPAWTLIGNENYLSQTPSGIAADKKDGSVYLTGSYGVSFGNSTNQGGVDAFLAKFDSAGALKWVLQIGSSVYDVGEAVAVDSAQNVYIEGYTAGNLNGVTHIGASGDLDAFIAKYNKDGVHQWTRLLGTTTHNDAMGAITVDSHDNIYVTGTTLGTLDTSEQPSANAGEEHVFIARYNTAGDLQWVKQMWTLNVAATPASSWGASITTDPSGNDLYVAGWTEGVFAGTTSNGGSDAFLAKYTPDGAKVWTRQFGTLYSDMAFGVACDSVGNVYTAGTTNDGGNAFLYKHDSSGNLIWTRSIESATAYERGIGVVVDGSDGVFIAGDGPDNINGMQDLDVIKYDTNGNQQWTQLWGGARSVYSTGVALSSDGGILVGGETVSVPGYGYYSLIHKFVSP